MKRIGIGPSAVGLCFLLLLASANGAHAQITGNYTYSPGKHAYFFTNDATIYGGLYDAGGGNDVFVGKDDPAHFQTVPGPFTLTIAKGADIGYAWVSSVYPDGVTYNGVNVFGNNRVQMDGGSAYGINGWDNSAINITGGQVTENVYAYANATLHMSGGYAKFASVRGNGNTGDITGGAVTVASAEDLCTLAIYNGTFGASGSGGAFAFGSGTLNIMGGAFERMGGTVSGIVNFSGGNAQVGVAVGSATVNITGGSVVDLQGYDNGIFNIKGGTIGKHTIRLSDNATVNLFGSGLDLASAGTGTDADGFFDDYVLVGTLQDGTSIDGVHLHDYAGGMSVGDPGQGADNTGSVHFLPAEVGAAAPEPGAIALLSLGSLFPVGIAARRRRIRADNREA